MLRYEVRLFRSKGVLLGRKAFDQQKPHTGEVWVREVQDDERHRSVDVAHIGYFGPAPNPPEPLKLYDVSLVSLGGTYITLRGYERIENAEFAQSWHCTILCALEHRSSAPGGASWNPHKVLP